MERTLEYELGHSDFELERLARQARLVDPFTERYFRAAGLAEGMRVVELGSGGGDTALLVASIIGESGEVVGLDRSADAIAASTARVRGLGKSNIMFRRARPDALQGERPFDALVGRYVLQFNIDPAAMVRDAAQSVRRGGIVAFHEVDWSTVASRPTAPTFEKCRGWILETFSRIGTNAFIGLDLHSVFQRAGLGAPDMGLGALAGGAESGAAGFERIADLVMTMAPAIAQLGVATLEEIDAPTLGERMIAEASALGSVIVGIGEVGAWARVP